MNPVLTEEQKAIQRAAKEFAEGEFDEDRILELEEKNEFPYEILKKASELGFIGVHYPQAFGGQGYGLFENVLITEEFCRKDSGVGIALSSTDMGADLILVFGDERQKERYLRPITKGKAISSLVCPETDEEVSYGLLTKIDRDRYLVIGETAYVLNGASANFFVAYCGMGSGKRPPTQSGIFVVIGRDANGLSVADTEDKLGMRMLPWNRLVFDKVEISQREILDAPINGFGQLAEARKLTLIKAGAQALGLSQGAFDRALAYSKQREQFGKKIGEFQGIRHKLVDMHIRIQATRLLVYTVASHYDEKGVDLCETAAANLYAEMTAVDVTDEALQIFGGAGYMIETPVEHFFRDARIMRTISGRQLSQKDVIAHSIIGTIT